MAALEFLLAALLTTPAQQLPLSPAGAPVDEFVISPDGSRVVFSTRATSSTQAEVYSVSLANFELTRRTPAGSTAAGFSDLMVAPGSNHVVFRGGPPPPGIGDLYSAPLSTRGLAQRLGASTPSQPISFGLNSGSVLFVDNVLKAARLDHAWPPRNVSGPGGAVTWHLLSPNGRTAVFLRNDELWAVPAHGGVALRISSDAGLPLAFSSDGLRVFFLSSRRTELCEVPADGSAARTVLVPGLPFFGSFYLTPDKTGLLVTDPVFETLSLIEFLSTTVTPLDPDFGNLSDRLWSSDGSLLVYADQHLIGFGPDSSWYLELVEPRGTRRLTLASDLRSVTRPFVPVGFEADNASFVWLQQQGPSSRLKKFDLVGSGGITDLPFASSAAAITPDNRLVFTTSANRLVVLPEVANVPPMLTIPCDLGRFALTPEGRRVLYLWQGQLHLEYLDHVYVPNRR